jgi:[ribosomal protein S5]-alanine N-acetyltransferase
MIKILTPRFLLRELLESDVTDSYLSWFQDRDAQQNISVALQMASLTALKKYVADRAVRQDVLFLGIFTRSDNRHIGNIKYEPVDMDRGVAVMGILIGESSFRGKGVAQEVLAASGSWLRVERGISRILLGVRPSNYAAIAAYEKAGFRRSPTDPDLSEMPERLVMAWEP